MKKVVRIVWISALSGLAFLAACCTQHGLTRKERKQLVQERDEVMMELEKTKSYEVGGSLNDFLGHKDDIYALENRLDAINHRLGDSIDLDRNIRRRQILRRIDSLDYLIKNYVPPCIYGSPEMLENYVDREFESMQSELKKAQKELDDLDRTETEGAEIIELLYGGPDMYINEPEQPVLILHPDEEQKADSIQMKKEAQRKRDSIRQTRKNNDRSCVYGPPPSSQENRKKLEEINQKYNQLRLELDSLESIIKTRDSIGATGSPEEMEEYNKETSSLKREWENKYKECLRLKNERKARRL